jgi:hypothetical protein
MSQNEQVERVTAVQSKYQDILMSKPNVVGVAVGVAKAEGVSTGELALVVMVDKKIPDDELALNERIPSVLDGVRVDVQEVGTLTAF